MNDQLPPIDSDLRRQLARRSTGRLPEGLLADVAAALDAAVATRAIARSPRLAWRVPRLAAAGMGAALVAILAVALTLPAFRGGPAASPAGYPTDRALTTAELTALLAGPPLATNTTLVVSATIDARTDVCPMNRYPTVGVIDGIDPQVCVMGGPLWGQMPSATVTGTFAFRYLGERSLGLLGQITPASSSKLAFHIADDWPLGGKTFLVQGWLGATVNPSEKCVAPGVAEYGDPLDPTGYDCPYSDWFSDTASLPAATPPRLVDAAGARHFDSMGVDTPVHGVFVVRSVTEQCPNASPQDNTGCGAWLVLAKVADISIPEPTAPPTATATPLAGYPAGRALTTAELASVMAGPALPTNTALVASVTIDAKTDVCPMNRYPTIGVVAGMGSQVCVMGAGVSAYLTTASETGTFAFRYLAPGILGLLGEITPASPSQLTFRATDAWPTDGSTFLVDGWLYEIDGWNGFPQVSGSVQYACPANTPEPAGDPLDPTGSDWCIYTWLGDSSAGPSFPFGPGDARPVEAAGMVQIDAIPAATAVYGTYVVRTVSEECPQASSGDTRNCGLILATVADTLKLAPSVAPAMPTPTAAPPATPVALPTGPLRTAPIGLMGSGNRPLTEGEFATLWAADPAHLAGGIAIVKGPVPTGFECWSGGAADGAAASPGCHIAILDGFIAQEGYWAVRVGADGKLAIVGQVATTQGSFVFTLEQAVAVWSKPAQGNLLIVDAWLDWANDCDTPETKAAGSCGYSLLTSERIDWMHMRSLWPADSKAVAQYVQWDAYSVFGSKDFGQAVRGLHLVDGTTMTILARLEVAPQ
jgi:hypothetical protein